MDVQGVFKNLGNHTSNLQGPLLALRSCSWELNLQSQMQHPCPLDLIERGGRSLVST